MKTQITKEQALAIYNEIANGGSRRAMKVKYRIHLDTVSRILDGSLFPELKLDPIVFTGVYKAPEGLSTIERLMDRVVKNPESRCWEWTGVKCESGYGRIKLNGKNVATHRLSFTLHNGIIPHGLQVLHHCDNPCCINPDHLWLGTNADNVFDRVQKDRTAKGSASGSAKINETIAIDIATSFNSGESVRDIASRHGMIEHAVRGILRGDYWSHITGIKDANDRRKKLNPELVLRAVELHKSGMTKKGISELLNVSRATIVNITLGKVWKKVTGIKSPNQNPV